MRARAQVYDYADAFEGAVISDADHCMVVELRAWGGLAISGDGAAAASPASLGESFPQVSLFSGLVGSDAMQAAYARLALPGRASSAAAAERIVMAGPGGRGRVEVAVSEPAGSARGGGMAARVSAPALQCCVMSVCLPWDALARDVLFKAPAAA